jgi:hypothetical protein
MELTKEQIEKINAAAPMEWQTNEQGVFTEPYGISNHIKEPVIYMRWHVGGLQGGSCWDDSDPRPYTVNTPKPEFTVLDLVLRELMPNITLLQFRKVLRLVEGTHKTDYEYYGNCTEYEIEYIVLSKLIEKLKSF